MPAAAVLQWSVCQNRTAYWRPLTAHCRTVAGSLGWGYTEGRQVPRGSKQRGVQVFPHRTMHKAGSVTDTAGGHDQHRHQ